MTVELWVPDQDGRESLGALAAPISCHAFARRGPPPPQILDAEFLVPSHATRGLLELLPRMGRLRVIQTLSAGVDWLLPAVPDGTTLCDARGCRDAAVAEWVIAAMLALARCLPELRDRQREHVWRAADVDSADLSGRTVLILGYGSIGKALEQRLEAFGVELVRVARRRRPGVHAVAQLASLLGGIDVLVVLLPFTPETDGLLSAGMLELLPAGSWIINAARGRIVDQDALVAHLQTRRLRAALDVTDPEPLPPQHPLWDAPGTLITPHLGGDTPAGAHAAFALAGEQARRYVRGEALVNVVRDGY